MTQNNTQEEFVEYIPKNEKSRAEKTNEERSERAKFNTTGKTAKEIGEEVVNAYDESVTERMHNTNSQFENRAYTSRSHDVDELLSKFNSITEQSDAHSNKIAEKIRIHELGEDSTNLLLETTSGLEKLHNSKSTLEKTVDLIPIPFIKRKLGDAINVAEKEANRNRTVRDYAERHFNILKDKKNHVNENRIAVDEIAQKLIESNNLLNQIRDDAMENLEYMKENDIHDKATEIKTKELILNVGDQIISQRDILEQSYMFESIASVISEKINATLPLLKTQMTDQVSVTASLKALSDYKNSIEQTKDMVLQMQQNSLKEMNSIMDDHKANGLGETKRQAEMRRQNEKIIDDIRNKNRELKNSYEDSLNKRMQEVTRKVERSNEIFEDLDSIKSIQKRD